MSLARSRLIPFVVLVAVLLWAGARSGTAADSTVPADSTTVEGEVPAELKGRWVVAAEAYSLVGEKETGTGKSVILRTFDVQEGDGGRLTITLHRGSLPDDLKRAIDARAVPPSKRVPVPSPGAPSPLPAGNAAPPAGERPSPQVMAELTLLWPTLLSPETDPRSTESRWLPFAKVEGRDRVRVDDPDARYGLAFKETYPAKGESPSRESETLLAIESIGKDRMTGKFMQGIAVVGINPASASFPYAPTSIRLKGDFVAHRLPDAGDGKAGSASTAAGGQAKGFLESLFSGCNG